MLTSVSFDRITGFSRLFCEFIAGNHLFSERFPMVNSAFLATRSAEFVKRRELYEAIADTMHGLTLSAAQLRSLDVLGDTKGLAVVTGQQVGFLGGANYTALKLYSAVARAQQYAEDFTDFSFAPVFWIEDDDHDAAEAAETAIFTESGEPMRISCAAPDEPQGLPVSARVFGDNVTDISEKIKEALPESQYTEGFMELLGKIYKPGISWTEAFVHILHELFRETGIVFIAASAVRRHRLAADIIRKETGNPKKTAESIKRISARLLDFGFHAQLTGSEINLFYLESIGKRSKIHAEGNEYIAGERRWAADELCREAEEYPERFSPNAALRPLVQDSIIPTVCYVAGPGEVAYLSQLREVYEFFGVMMPAVEPRHSATLITPSVARFLQKSEIIPEFFLRPWNEIDREIAALSRSEEFDAAMARTEQGLTEAFGILTEAVAAADATLAGSAKAALNQTLKSVEHIQKKAVAALKRKNEMNYAKYKATADLTFPFGNLQERAIAAAVWYAAIGNENLNRTLSVVAAQSPNAHFFASLFQ